MSIEHQQPGEWISFPGEDAIDPISKEEQIDLILLGDEPEPNHGYTCPRKVMQIMVGEKVTQLVVPGRIAQILITLHRGEEEAPTRRNIREAIAIKPGGQMSLLLLQAQNALRGTGLHVMEKKRERESGAHENVYFLATNA